MKLQSRWQIPLRFFRSLCHYMSHYSCGDLFLLWLQLLCASKFFEFSTRPCSRTSSILASKWNLLIGFSSSPHFRQRLFFRHCFILRTGISWFHFLLSATRKHSQMMIKLRRKTIAKQAPVDSDESWIRSKVEPEKPFRIWLHNRADHRHCI